MRDAASQLGFLKEVGTAGVGSLQAPDLLYLQGLLAWKQGQDMLQVCVRLAMAYSTPNSVLLVHLMGSRFSPFKGHRVVSLA